MLREMASSKRPSSPAPPLERRVPQTEEARLTMEAILEAAYLVARDDGAEQVTTTRVAERAGVGVGTVYQYFADRETLLLASEERANARLAERIGRRMLELAEAPSDEATFEIVREAVKARMANAPGVEIVGEAETGEAVVDKVRELEPDVCIVDVELPGQDGIEATKAILKARPETRVIIFTAHAQPDLLTLALRAGASGYVLKSAPSEDIARAIEVVAGGGTFVGTELGQGAGEVEKLLELTPREREILELLAEGLRVKQIADRLSLSPATVHTHVRNAIARMEAQSAEAAQVVRLRFFAGLSVRETARVMDLSVPTILQLWRYARAWLFRALESDQVAS